LTTVSGVGDLLPSLRMRDPVTTTSCTAGASVAGASCADAGVAKDASAAAPLLPNSAASGLRPRPIDCRIASSPSHCLGGSFATVSQASNASPSDDRTLIVDYDFVAGGSYGESAIHIAPARSILEPLRNQKLQDKRRESRYF